MVEVSGIVSEHAANHAHGAVSRTFGAARRI